MQFIALTTLCTAGRYVPEVLQKMVKRPRLSLCLCFSHFFSCFSALARLVVAVSDTAAGNCNLLHVRL